MTPPPISSPRTCFLLKPHCRITSVDKALLDGLQKGNLQNGAAETWRGISSKNGAQFVLPEICNAWGPILVTTNATL